MHVLVHDLRVKRLHASRTAVSTTDRKSLSNLSHAGGSAMLWEWPENAEGDTGKEVDLSCWRREFSISTSARDFNAEFLAAIAFFDELLTCMFYTGT